MSMPMTAARIQIAATALVAFAFAVIVTRMAPRANGTAELKNPAAAGTLKVLLAGDVMLGRLVNDVLRERSPAYPWGDTLPLMRSADVRIVNLECVISDKGRPWTVTPKLFHFRSDAKNAEALKAAGIDAVSLANNHALDYGYEAMSDMLRLLGRAGVRHAGAGNNRVEACKPAIFDVRGVRVGLIAFTDNEPPWEATAARAGVCYAPINPADRRAKEILRTVSEAKAGADLLIVSAHWGPNWRYRPPPEHVTFGRLLAEAGADVVFGHSAHVFRGIEIHRGKPILYSAGDFIDDYAVDDVERNDESFVFLLDVTAEAVREISLYPSLIRHFQARRARDAEALRISQRMIGLCSQLGTAATWLPAEGRIRITISR